ncbi:MAG TPA: hypothetical protein VNR11_20770 [Xanthobacteraceae bacterium]|nr:hypothetical protein [Xanthobacteraceae bacterium]
MIGGVAAVAVLAGGLALAQSPGRGDYGMHGSGPGARGDMDRGQRMGGGMHGFMGHGGGGMGHMAGGMMGMSHGSATPAEMGEIHDMLVNHDLIKRTVTNLPDGIRTVTESDDPEMAATIASHVAGMGERVKEGRDPDLPIQSPTLKIIFRNKDKIKTTYESTPKGVVVIQTSDDPETVAALQKHAGEVSDLARRGMIAAHETMMQNMAARMGHGTGATMGPRQYR